MHKLSILAAFAGLALAGCGGQLGHNSPVQARLITTNNTTDFGSDHLIISPNNGAADSAGASTDQQAQSWSTVQVSGSFKEIDFTTTSQQVPYFVYLRNNGAAQDEVRLQITMDGNVKYDQVLQIGAGATVQETSIFRNNVQSP